MHVYLSGQICVFYVCLQKRNSLNVSVKIVNVDVSRCVCFCKGVDEATSSGRVDVELVLSDSKLSERPDLQPCIRYCARRIHHDFPRSSVAWWKSVRPLTGRVWVRSW